jgi:hypothetical protein
MIKWFFMILGIFFICGIIWALIWDGYQCVGTIICL